MRIISSSDLIRYSFYVQDESTEAESLRISREFEDKKIYATQFR